MLIKLLRLLYKDNWADACIDSSTILNLFSTKSVISYKMQLLRNGKHINFKNQNIECGLFS